MTSADPEAIVAVTETCPAVAGMSSGALGEVATFLPGRRVPGVRITPEQVEVHVVARWDVSLPELGDQVREAVEPLVGSMPVAVFIDDIEVPGHAEDASGST